MRITSDGPDLLVIDHFALGTVLAVLAFIVAMVALGASAIIGGAWGAGLALLVFGGGSGLAVLSAVTERCRLSFDRVEGEVTLVRRTFRGAKTRRFPLDRITKAGTQTKLDWRYKPTLHRLVIYLNKGPGILVTETHFGGDAAKEMATAINRWLAAGVSAATLAQPPGPA
jgi:hypothetical protein